MVQARIARLIYGADDAKGGAIRTCMQVLDAPALNHRVETTSGILAEESIGLLQSFFATRRGPSRRRGFNLFSFLCGSSQTAQARKPI